MQTQSSLARSADASADVLRMPQTLDQESQPLAWWKQGAIYQLVVPSFQDSNGDGVGDLPGIIERLDYLQWLGARGIWLSPFYPSPLKDMGYDVMDYKNVHPRYGTLDDFDRLVDEAHRRDLKIVLDWVANHTSDQHPWFQESRASRDNPKRDWYLWHDPQPDGSPPNNWISIFGGSVWQWDEQTEQYYMHTFLPSQVDLNWRHADVQREMLDVLRFWLDRDVDGFRIDATSLMVKDTQFRDNPPNPDYRPEHDLPDTQLLPKYTRNQPPVHDILVKCRRMVASYGEDRLLAGELYLRPEELIPYYGTQENPELHLPFNLLLPWSPWTKEGLSELIGRYEQHVPADGWSTWTVNTHDCERFASRVSREQSRVAAMLLYTLPGTPTHYYGEELGMAGQEIPPECSVDPQGRRTGRNRDSERTPMQWTTGENAGFTKGNPWLPVAADYAVANAAQLTDDPTSILSLYRKLISLRRDEPALSLGAFLPVEDTTPLLVFERHIPERHLLVILNLESQPHVCELAGSPRGTILLSTTLQREGETVQPGLTVSGDEGLVVALDPQQPAPCS